MELEPGSVVGNRYRVERELGRDEGGTVIVGYEAAANRRVALKIFPTGTPDNRVAVRFARVARIHSVHVPGFVDIGSLPDGRPFVVLELLEGETLSKRLGKRYPVAEAVDYVVQTCDGIGAAHAADVVHRRLTSSSLFISQSGGLPCVKVLNFGDVALCAADPSGKEHLPDTQRGLRSATYMAPELFDVGKHDGRCDIWSLGVVLYELLTGTHPFEGKSLDKIIKAVRSDGPKKMKALRSVVPRGIEETIVRSLQTSPDERWQSVAEFAHALAPFASPPFQRLAGAIWRPAPAASGGPAGARVPISRPAEALAAPAQVPVFAAKPEDDIGFRKFTSDGRIEDLDAATVANLTRGKRVAKMAEALAREGPRTVASEDQSKLTDLKPLGGDPAPVMAIKLPIDLKPAKRSAKAPTAILILIAAVIFGLLVGVIFKLALAPR